MVFRVFVEKRKELAHEAQSLLGDARNLLMIEGLKDVRIINRYDAEAMDRPLFDYAVQTVFSEPQVDLVYGEQGPDLSGAVVFAVEYLPGQFDQRADSAAQCIQLISRQDRPLVRSAKVYALYGSLSDADVSAIKKYVINPVEAREASLEKPETLKTEYEIPTTVRTIDGFRAFSRAELEAFIRENGLAMDIDDIAFCQKYFLEEDRDPTITEIKMIDTYWSDHCRHTTFNTIIDSIQFEDALLQEAYDKYLKTRRDLNRTKPVSLMDIGTLAAKALKKAGRLDKLDESEEINACTVKIKVDVDGVTEDWLLLFKNETHNHPTEIEPFGGAATCIGGAIRDPLSGRSYVYAAMRVTGASDPLQPVSETIPGKLPQRKIVTTAANGYSSYGNQIGLTTGIVDELYHPGYAAKRMEIGAVIAAAPAANVRREVPAPGDVVILLGGSTGRDGIGGATGSSKAHDSHSVENCGAEVQKGNAPEERKLQRLFRNAEASRLIKRCNDFGAGGVSVAIGELADGLDIDLNAVPKKYEGLDGTELAISESQERMACCVEAKDEKRFLELAAGENLQACRVAVVKEEPRLTMTWNGEKIVDISRAFLDTNGAEKHITVEAPKAELRPQSVVGIYDQTGKAGTEDNDAFGKYMRAMADDLNCCSRRGLSERFDSQIGAGTVLMPFGGKYQQTPIQTMVHKISVEKAHTDDCSLMAWGYDPFVTEASPFHGAYLAVADSVCKLVAAGAEFKDVYLSFQEYFQKLGHDPKKWGQPLSALLGAFRAQMELGVAAIGGKDSMSGSFEDIHVPPTLVSFAVTTQKTADIISPEFKGPGHKTVQLIPQYGTDGLPVAASLLEAFDTVTALMRKGIVAACYTPGMGGLAEAVLKMGIGNGIGFAFDESLSLEDIFKKQYCTFLMELTGDAEIPSGSYAVRTIGVTGCSVAPGTCCDSVSAFDCDVPCISWKESCLSLEDLQQIYEEKLESVFACNIEQGDGKDIENYCYEANEWPKPLVKPAAKPRVLIPVFPGNNCEYDSAKSMRDAGAQAEIYVIKNLTAEAVSRSVDEFAARVRESQMIFIPGGFSGGDEPDGSGKFITAFFRNEAVKEAVGDLLDVRGGLMCGICNGFQALIKLGLVPYGRIIDTDASCPTLTFNTIGRHQSRIVQTRIASNKSPWLALTKPGEVYSVPISHGEGRFLASEELIAQLAANGQIATQYVDLEGRATADVHFNPNNSMAAIEGITSPDGRVFGKMGHAERTGAGLYKNVPGNYDIRMFEAAVKFFK
ncbi:MAG: phosphoribosylformylglycinamidine synthase [Lachnospiraceae bacterium]|nr:phosphoribosylformylglycinamidine synthase [Lachnospiraceae bacterium]